MHQYMHARAHANARTHACVCVYAWVHLVFVRLRVLVHLVFRRVCMCVRVHARVCVLVQAAGTNL